jgi:hypothetical protein
MQGSIISSASILHCLQGSSLSSVINLCVEKTEEMVESCILSGECGLYSGGGRMHRSALPCRRAGGGGCRPPSAACQEVVRIPSPGAIGNPHHHLAAAPDPGGTACSFFACDQPQSIIRKYRVRLCLSLSLFLFPPQPLPLSPCATHFQR